MAERRSCRVALVNPPVASGAAWVREGRCQQLDIWGAPFPPLTLGRVAALLDGAGLEARIFDGAVDPRPPGAFIDAVASWGPSLVLLSTATPTLRSDGLWFAPRLRELVPGVVVAALGIHVTALPERTLADFPALDLVVVGEPELTCVELAAALARGDSPSAVAGLALRQGEGTVRTPPRPVVEDVDLLPPPAWPGLDRGLYRMPILGTPFTLVETARGCPHGCTYCPSRTWYGRRPRRRSARAVADEVERDLARGIRDFLFWSESFTGDRTGVLELTDELRRRGLQGRIRWVCNSRVDGADPEVLAAMRSAGCWQVAFGLEFGSAFLLRRTGKGRGVTPEAGEAAVRRAVEAGMVVDGHFILGHPGETGATMDATVALALRLPLTFAHFYCASPFPGSELHDEARASGWLRDEDLYEMSQSRHVLHTPELTPETVHAAVARAYRRFYLRPSVWGRIGAIPRGLRQWAAVAGLGARFVGRLVTGAGA